MWMQGKSGITPIERFDTSEYATRFAGEVKELATDGFVSKKNVRRLDDTIKYILVSGKQVGWSPSLCGSPHLLFQWGPHSLHSVAAVQSSYQGHKVLHQKGFTRSDLLALNGPQALDDAGIDWRGEGMSGLDVSRCGILIGTAMGGMATFTAAVEDLAQKASTQLYDCSIASRILHSILHSFQRIYPQ